MKKESNYDRLMRLDREKRSDPDYVKREREALQKGWKPKKKDKRFAY